MKLHFTSKSVILIKFTGILPSFLSLSLAQVRVVQGREPPHLLAAFQGKFAVFQREAADAPTHLLHVQGSNQLATRATQVDLAAAALNTNHCFLLVSPDARNEGGLQ